MKSPEQKAREVLKQFGTTVPVDVVAIAKSYGLEIYTDPLEDSVSGMLIVRNNGGVIGVNNAHHPNRQRFTIAHELGHYLLHSDTSSVFIDAVPIFFRDESSADGSKRREIEANRFAAELLMPRDVLQQYAKLRSFDPSDDTEAKCLAAKFGVSIQALLIRLTKLGLIDT